MIIAWEKPMRDWVKAQTGLEVMSGFPLGTPIWPVTVLERIGGGPGVGEDQPRARFRVWDESKTRAEESIVQVGKLIERSDGFRTELIPGLFLVATEVHRLVWMPDISLDGKPSYLMDATLVFIEES